MKLWRTYWPILTQMWRIVWLATLAACFAGASTQELTLPDHPRFTFRGVPEGLGLSTATVTSLVQDHDGFLWIGTQAGLFRYDCLTVMRFGSYSWLPSFYIT